VCLHHCERFGEKLPEAYEKSTDGELLFAKYRSRPSTFLDAELQRKEKALILKI
jgi:hypothetical protein